MKPPPKIRRFKPLDFSDAQKKYDDIQNEIKILQDAFERKRSGMKFSQIVSAEKQIQRLNDLSENIIDNVLKENKKNVYRESLNGRIDKAISELKLRSVKAWYNGKEIKSSYQIFNELKNFDSTLQEEYTTEFGKKAFYSFFITQHFIFFGRELNEQWKNEI